MRWLEYTAALPLSQHERLVNHLTVGCGHITYAWRLIRHNADVSFIALRLLEAQATLVVARASLLTEPGMADAGRVTLPDPESLPSIAWQGFFAQQPASVNAQVLTILEDAVRCARLVSQSLLANGDVDEMRNCLDQVMVALARARQLIAAAS